VKDVVATAFALVAGCYFIVLGGICLLAPLHARQWMLAFARSRGSHYFEVAVRAVAGGALLLGARHFASPGAFQVAGLTLIVTAVFLLLIPCTWHRRFAGSVRPAIGYVHLLSLGSLGVGVAGVWGALRW
jgi:hypothetical protein